jgi:hypothetical protein
MTTIQEKVKNIWKKIFERGEEGLYCEIIWVDSRNRYIVDYEDLPNEVFCYSESEMRKHNKLALKEKEVKVKTKE